MFRFTPTPSGYLHIGNAFNFVLTWLIAREKQAEVLLRIDDLDAARRRDEYVEDIFRSIDALGLSYDKGPSGPDDFYANWSQHHRMALYEEALQKIASEEDCVYGCKLSRKQIHALKEEGRYPLFARKQAVELQEPDIAWRVKVAGIMCFRDLDGTPYELALENEMPDFVIRRKDGLPAYQIASVADDQHFGVTGIVRGKDLLASTAAQLWLAEKLGYKEFKDVTLLHHPLFKGAQQEKLSKSAGALSLRQMLEKPEQVWRWIALAMSLPPCTSLHELQASFSLQNLTLSSIVINS